MIIVQGIYYFSLVGEKRDTVDENIIPKKREDEI